MADENLHRNDSETSREMIAELRATFRDEAYELLAELESALLELEQSPDDKERINRAFRALHTIKGSGAVCEFTDVSRFAHEIETLFDRVRNGRLAVSQDLINAALASRDRIKSMFDRLYNGGNAGEVRVDDVLLQVRSLLDASTAPDVPHTASSPETVRNEMPGTRVTYRVRFKTLPEMENSGIRPEQLMPELEKLGTCRIMACSDDSSEGIGVWDVIVTTDRGKDAIQDLFIFIKDSCELRIEAIDEDGALTDERSYKKLGEILLERGDLTPEDIQEVLREKKKFGELLVENGVVPPAKVESALMEQQHVREMREQRKNVDEALSIRVPAAKLDSLVNLVGELVTVQARLTQSALSLGHAGLLALAEDVERLTGSLRDTAMNIRMLPIGTTFSRFKRLVRDLAAEEGKEIEMVAEGGGTELDKTVIERLSDPLVHLIRNSIDHGIEMPDARESAGKPRRGTIRLSAMHSGSHVLIRIADDGTGLDPDAIRATAMERGLIKDPDVFSERELRELIFSPGFSTARSITSVSGRGVGLDVVKRSVEALRGAIEVESGKDKGTTITLKIPLTLAIIDGFLTKIGPEYFVFPLAVVAECVELVREKRDESGGRRLARVRDKVIPYIRLRDQFMMGGDPPDVEHIVITGANENRVGFVVDQVIGSHQTVIKNLGSFFRDVPGISGATILGDGAMAMILDVPGLVRTAVLENQGAPEHSHAPG